MPSLQCVAAYDIQPEDSRVGKKDCLTLTQSDCVGARVFITNPPFDWGMLKPILDHLPTLLPTWLLLPADLMHNKRMSPYMGYCTDVVSVGRLWWFKDENYKKVKGVDNFCWYKFCDPKDAWGFRIQFHGRVL